MKPREIRIIKKPEAAKKIPEDVRERRAEITMMEIYARKHLEAFTRLCKKLRSEGVKL